MEMGALSMEMIDKLRTMEKSTQDEISRLESKSFLRNMEGFNLSMLRSDLKRIKREIVFISKPKTNDITSEQRVKQ